MQPARSIKIGWILMLILGLYRIVMSAIAVTIGGMNVFTGILLATIAAAIIGISLGSYRRAERWSWWCLLVIGFAPFLGSTAYIDVVTIEITEVLVGWVLFIVALIIPAKAILSKQPAASKPRNLETPRVQQKQEWWKSKPIWVVVIIILGALVFGIVQPFVWKWVYGQYPPRGTIDLSTLLTIILTLLAIGISAFGVGVYLLLKERIIKIAQREAGEKSTEVQTDVIRRLVSQFVKTDINIAHQKWKEWERVKRKKGLPQKDKEKEYGYLRDMAIACLRDIFKFAKSTLPLPEYKDFWENPTDKKNITLLKNNLAYYLAHRREEKDAEDARQYAREVEQETRSQSVPNYHYLDTVAWVLKQFPLSEEDKEKSKSIIAELEQRPDIKKDDKEKLLYKYKKKP